MCSIPMLHNAWALARLEMQENATYWISDMEWQLVTNYHYACCLALFIFTTCSACKSFAKPNPNAILFNWVSWHDRGSNSSRTPLYGNNRAHMDTHTHTIHNGINLERFFISSIAFVKTSDGLFQLFVLRMRFLHSRHSIQVLLIEETFQHLSTCYWWWQKIIVFSIIFSVRALSFAPIMYTDINTPPFPLSSQ